MRVAITSEGKSLKDNVDPRFGRAKYFLVVETESRVVEVVDNEQNLNALQGAGVQSAEIVANLDVEAVITGHCGPKAFLALNAAGIDVFTGATGTVEEAVELLANGKLSKSEGPDVEAHWQ
jgi:predicted Fe-Mo cluster-binding NifX family protein